MLINAHHLAIGSMLIYDMRILITGIPDWLFGGMSERVRGSSHG
jgi:hypothetical protein